MTKLKAKGYEVLDPSTYVLEVVEAEPINVYEPQLKITLRVATGEHESFVFVDYPNCGSENGVKVGTKAWDVFEACLDHPLSVNEELDTDDLIGKRFVARVLVRRNGRGNYTEHGSIASYQPDKDEPEAEEESSEDDRSSRRSLSSGA